MLPGRSASVDQISAEWTARLATIPTVLGRLEILSSLRDRHTGRYVHHGMSICVGECAHDVLLKSHTEIFADWQAMSIREQLRDLRTFVSSIPTSENSPDRRANRLVRSRLILETWSELESYRNFIPMSASKLERGLFLANLSSTIGVLINQLADLTCNSKVASAESA
jgi:hypothetical protein